MHSHWKQAMGEFAIAALIATLCVRLALDTAQLWNAQSEFFSDRWVMVGPGNMLSVLILHIATRSRAWIGLSMLLMAFLLFWRRLRPRKSSTTRLGMYALWIVAPTLLTDSLTLHGQTMPDSWLVLSGIATLAPLAIWLYRTLWTRQSLKVDGFLSRTIATPLVIATLLIGVAWLRDGVEFRGRWSDTSAPVPSPRLMAPETPESCSQDVFSETAVRWGNSGEVSGFEWVVVTADGQVFSSPGSLVTPPGVEPDWHPTGGLRWPEDWALGPRTGILLLVDQRVPRARVDEIERVLASTRTSHVMRIGVQWNRHQPLGFPALDIGVLCSW